MIDRCEQSTVVAVRHRDTVHRVYADSEGRGLVGWGRRWWRALVAEALATALLVWLGVASLLTVPGKAAPPLTHPAWAFGLVVVGNAMAFGPASGAHMNPAVSLAAAIYGKLPWGACAAYAVSQCVGAVAGMGAVLATLAPAAPGGCTAPAPALGAVRAAVIEAGITGVLALACCGAWAAHDDARPDPTVPLKLGLVVAGLVFVGGEATGASLNPARSLAPALLHGHWSHLWVYVAGPLAGAALAAAAHRWLLAPRPRPRPRPRPCPRAPSPEELPLDKP